MTKIVSYSKKTCNINSDIKNKEVNSTTNLLSFLEEKPHLNTKK
nr:MAG TPA: hypothetical protein [Herelleviridae sp.]